MKSPQEALKELHEGNRRFISGVRSRASTTCERRTELTAGQAPFAVVLGCSDSRVPPEIVFDQGLGDLFVIRVAGNIVGPTQMGSVEMAAEDFGARLVVVLGHSSCGAVLATLEDFRAPKQRRAGNLGSIVDHIRPSVTEVPASDPGLHREALVREAVRANICASVGQLRHDSEILKKLIERSGLLVVGAEYSLASGVVDFFENSIDSERSG